LTNEILFEGMPIYHSDNLVHEPSVSSVSQSQQRRPGSTTHPTLAEVLFPSSSLFPSSGKSHRTLHIAIPSLHATELYSVCTCLTMSSPQCWGVLIKNISGDLGSSNISYYKMYNGRFCCCRLVKDFIETRK
jgi:hypothetical protein